MPYALGTSVTTAGCMTRLRDVVNRTPEQLEDLVGFHRGRLSQGFQFLLLQEAVSAGDFEFFGYTYMSGGRTGLPDNDPAKEAARPKVHDALRSAIVPKAAQDDVQKKAWYQFQSHFAGAVPLKGEDRFVKIVPQVGHDTAMGPADQYPASRLGIKQLKLTNAKLFLVAASVRQSIWTLANGGIIDVSRVRYDLPYRDDPRKQVMDYLASA